MKYKKGDEWTDDVEVIAKQRGVKPATIKSYLSDSKYKGGLKFEKHDDGSVWFYLGKQVATSKKAAKQIQNKDIKKEQLLTMSKFVRMFCDHTGMKSDKVKGMIADGVIESRIENDVRVIPFWDMTTTLTNMKKGKDKKAERVLEVIIEEQEIEEKIDFATEEIQIGASLRPKKWADQTDDERNYGRLSKALRDGAFGDIPRDLFYAEDFGEKHSSWELEWPGKTIAKELCKLMEHGARNTKRLRLSIINLLTRYGYKSGVGPAKSTKKEDSKKSIGVAETDPLLDPVSKGDLDNFKNFMRSAIKERDDKFDRLETKCKKLFSQMESMKDTIRDLNKAKVSGGGWGNL